MEGKSVAESTGEPWQRTRRMHGGSSCSLACVVRRQWRCVLDIEYGDRAADLWGAHEFASATFPDVGRTISCLRALLTLFRRFRGHREAVGASACRLPFAAHAQNTYHGLYFQCFFSKKKRGKHIFIITQGFSLLVAFGFSSRWFSAL